MKNWIKKVVLPISLVGVVIGLSACGHHTPEEKQAKAVKKISYVLELEDHQKPQVEALVAAIFEMRADLKANRLDELQQVKASVASPTLDQALFIRLIDQKVATLNEHKTTIVNHLSQLHATLNDEQKAELLAVLGKVEKRWAD